MLSVVFDLLQCCMSKCSMSLCWVLLCWVLLCWVLLCWVLLCWVLLRWVLLRWVSLCWMSWRPQNRRCEHEKTIKLKFVKLLQPPKHPSCCGQDHFCQSWLVIFTTMDEPSKLECLFLAILSSLVSCNTLSPWAQW